MLLCYQRYICEKLVASFVEVKEKATYYTVERVVGGKNISTAPLYSCLSRRNTPANGWLCNSAETVSLYVDYNSAVCALVGMYTSSKNCCLKMHIKDSKEDDDGKLTRQQYLGVCWSFKSSQFKGN